MGRKTSLNKERRVDPAPAKYVNALLNAENVEKSILLLAKHIPTTARDWDKLTDIRAHLEKGIPLTADEVDTLILTEAVIELPPRVIRALDKQDVETISRFLSDLACPIEAIKPLIEMLFLDEHDRYAQDIIRIASKSNEAAKCLLSGKLLSARTAWTDRTPDQDCDDRTLFDDIIGTIRLYHLLDSLWLAGQDAGRKQEKPTGSTVVDGSSDGDALKIRKIGGLLNDLDAARIVIDILDRVARIASEEKRMEALNRIFPGIMPLARSFESDLRQVHGKHLEMLLTRWNQEGRRLAEEALRKIEIRVQKNHKGLPKAGYRNKFLANYLQMPTEVLYLAFACGAWWQLRISAKDNMLPIDVPSLSTDLTPMPRGLEMRNDWHAFYLIVKAYYLTNSRHLMKGLVSGLDRIELGDDVISRQDQVGDIIDKLGTPIGALKVSGSSSGLDARRTAIPLWDGLLDPNATPSVEGRRLKTECFGRFWLRMHL